MASSAFVLTPRGQARNSYFVWETLQMGLLPVYVWDDHEWLPYKGSPAEFDSYGFSVRLGSFKQRAKHIWRVASHPAELTRRRRRVLSLRRSHFTFEGVIELIELLLANGTAASDLRCLARAPLGGPLCPLWKDSFYQKGTTDCAPAWYPEERGAREDNLSFLWTQPDASAVGGGFTYKEYIRLPSREARCSVSQMLRGCAASSTLNASKRFPGFFAALIKAGRGDEILPLTADAE